MSFSRSSRPSCILAKVLGSISSPCSGKNKDRTRESGGNRTYQGTLWFKTLCYHTSQRGLFTWCQKWDSWTRLSTFWLPKCWDKHVERNLRSQRLLSFGRVLLALLQSATMGELSGIKPPQMEWNQSDLPTAFKSFKQYCQLISEGPLSAKEEKVILLWIGEEGRKIFNSFSLADEEKDISNTSSSPLSEHIMTLFSLNISLKCLKRSKWWIFFHRRKASPLRKVERNLLWKSCRN